MTEQMSYDEVMAAGAEQYRDVIDALDAEGLRAEFTQTGGMCAAIEILLPDGSQILLTDRDDTLSWDRASHRGWGAAHYEPADRQIADGPLHYLTTTDGSAASGVRLVQKVLRADQHG